MYSKLRFITAKGKVQTQQEKIHKQKQKKSFWSPIFRDDPHSFSPVVNLQGPVGAVVPKQSPLEYWSPNSERELITCLPHDRPSGHQIHIMNFQVYFKYADNLVHRDPLLQVHRITS